MKLERLLSMIYMLLNHEVVSASTLAEKYQVSQRTIYRDIDTICAAGFPVVSYQGVHGGYGIMKTYKMDRSLLGSYDVETLLTVLTSLSALFRDDHVSETIRKLRTIQKDIHAPSVSLDIATSPQIKQLLRKLRHAIKARKVISFTYISAKNEKTERSIEPFCLIYRHHSWYVLGYCLTRADYRQFKLTRMPELNTLSTTYQRQHEMPVQERKFTVSTTDDGRVDNSNQSSTMVEVELRFSKNVLARALDSFYNEEKIFNQDGSLTIHCTLRSKEDQRWFFPLLLNFGEDVEIIAPQEYREEFRQKIEMILRQYIYR